MEAELAQAVILDHDANPRNFGELADATHSAGGYNPLCGDKYTVWARVEAGVVRAVHFHGFGCALSKASASMMTEAARGVPVEALPSMRSRLFDAAPTEDLLALVAVKDQPTRARCALLAWHALERAVASPVGE
ncbi:MAG: SUF system NifU family Fe-S cluster assembly protein [Rhodothermales bacterium]|nr:SUF system NifU family Fe-S cluster assembly protein [Rhodothermales bacterium]MBO6779244.1 SUF system NifU family Fe-S cluster assembly protein [Rhodothermales bacterium]